MNFDGKNVVITGGNGGIGAAIARHALKNGAEKLALLDVEYRGDLMALLCDAFPQKRIIFHLVNVRERNSLERAFTEVMSKFQAIHCVVACAGVLNEPDYQLTVDVNLLGLIHTNYVAMSHMTKEKGFNGGFIVNIASTCGLDCSQFATPVYNATKHGVVAFTRSMGVQFYYERTAIQFVTICPGITETPLIDNLANRMYSEEARKSTNKILLYQTVDELAAAIIDVLKQDKNGSVWMIDGGTFKEVTFPNPWYDNGVQSQNSERTVSALRAATVPTSFK